MKNKLIAFILVMFVSVVALMATFWFTRETHASVYGVDFHGLVNSGVMEGVPTITAVTPSTAPNDLDTPVVISGTSFVAISGTQVITPPLVYLGETPLNNIVLVTSTTLSATIPWGLDVGVYTLTVVNPDGAGGSLSSAFTVTQGIGVWNASELYGGQIDQVVLDPFNPQTVFAVAGGVGFFRSQDGGQLWSILRPGVGTSALSASPAMPNRLYMQGSWNIRRLDDGGETWSILNPTFPITETLGENCGGYRTLPHPTLTDTVFLSLCSSESPGMNGLLRSDDAGETWIQSMDGLTDTQVTAITFHPTDPITMYLGTASGRLYISGDGGTSWQYASSPIGYIESISVDPFGEHSVWVNSIHGRDTPCETYKSSDDSLETWININPTPNPFCRKVVFDPVNADTVYVPTGVGYKSTNGGMDWDELDTANDKYATDISVDPNDPDTLYMSHGAVGIYKSQDGGATWYSSNTGLSAMIPNVIETLPGQPGTIFALFSNGIYKGTQGGAAWQNISPEWMSAIWDVCADRFVPNRLYVGALAGMCFSQDAGETFTGCVHLEPPPEFAGHGIWPQVIEADPSQTGTLLVSTRFITGTNFLSEGALYRTTDSGQSWNIITPTIGINARFIIYDPISPTVVYLVTEGDWLLRSMDGGLTWEQIAEDVPALQWSGPLAVEPVPPGRLWTQGMDMGVWVSDDHGNTWINLPYIGLGINVAAAIWLPGETAVLYAATPTGLSRSLDRGTTWESVPGVLGYANVTALDAIQVDERTTLYAGITGGLVEEGLLLSSQDMLGAGIYRYTYTKLILPHIRLLMPLVVK